MAPDSTPNPERSKTTETATGAAMVQSSPLPPGPSVQESVPQDAGQPTGVDGEGAQSANGRGKSQRGGNKELGRAGWQKSKRDKRGRNDDWQESKRRKMNHDRDAVEGESTQSKENPYSTEEIAAEGRRPKRKVAVLVGYSGTGYKGMQINDKEKTIEGDLFKAFVAAGAISKANADDPKKSSLVRCARTDKGVHAAGNVISLKLIIEDSDIVEKINDNLPDQIRVWGLLRTNNAFSCYQSCDSRWYEYLMPTYCLLPPHPTSFIWKKLVESAREHGVYDEFEAQFADVKGFWEEVEEKDIKPLLEKLDPEVRAEVLEKLHAVSLSGPGAEPQEGGERMAPKEKGPMAAEAAAVDTALSGDIDAPDGSVKPKHRELTPVDYALRDIKAAYITAKRRYRVTPARLGKLQDALNQYVGSYDFHNYTIQKSFKDPSAKRHIKSFDVNTTPIPIRDTEWISLKVHGQSFMMHQIRKMVSMVALAVRCATPLERIKQSYGEERIAIPKAPGLGLLLERPVFDAYNRKAKNAFNKDILDFKQYDDKIQEFKQREIYNRIFEVEEQDNVFHVYFQQVDNFKSKHFLWLTAGGIEAGKIRTGQGEKAENTLEATLSDEDEDPEGGEG